VNYGKTLKIARKEDIGEKKLKKARN